MGNTNSVFQQCAAENFTKAQEDCNITWTNDGRVEKFGTVGRGEMTPNPDIAGLGVFYSLVGPAGMVLLYAIILAGFRAIFGCLRHGKSSLRERIFSPVNATAFIHKFFDETITSLGDSQLLVILGYGISFHLSTKCELSKYHFNVLIENILTGLATTLLGSVLVRRNVTDLNSYEDGEQLLNVIARRLLFGVCLGGVAYYSGFGLFETPTRLRPTGVFFIPKPTQDDLGVMPVYCLMNTTLFNWGALDDDQRSELTPDGFFNLSFFKILVMIPLFFYTVLLKDFGQTLREPIEEMAEKVLGSMHLGRGLLKFGAKVIVWSTTVGIICWNIASIFAWRRWARESGWLRTEDGKNEEDVVTDLGQVQTIVTASSFLLSLLTIISRRLMQRKRRRNGK